MQHIPKKYYTTEDLRLTNCCVTEYVIPDKAFGESCIKGTSEYLATLKNTQKLQKQAITYRVQLRHIHFCTPFGV